MLRENQVFDISTVKIAIIEGSGKLSVLEQAKSTTTTLSYPVIREGQIESHVLSLFNLDESWLYDQLAQQDLDINHIFLATVDDQHQLHCTKYIEQAHQYLPPLYH
ncbi:hypothetical protein D3C77_485940 [compost metagenome]